MSSSFDVRAPQIPPDTDALMTALRAAGLPLAYSQDDADENASAASDIVCIAAVMNDNFHSVVVTPSGLVYRSEPEELDEDTWSRNFGARYYYWVTGNMADRLKVAEMAGVDPKLIKGRCLSGKKSDALSGLGLDALLEQLGYTPKAPQDQPRPVQSGFGF